MRSVSLILSTGQFDKLHEKANTKADSVRVDTESLRALLHDHSAALAALEKEGVKVEDLNG